MRFQLRGCSNTAQPIHQAGRAKARPLCQTLGGYMNIYLAFVLSVVITWSVGLVPALIIRYAILKRPMARKKATWASLAICFVMLLLSALFTTLVNERQGTYVWIVILFFFTRWILEKRPSFANPVEEL